MDRLDSRDLYNGGGLLSGLQLGSAFEGHSFLLLGLHLGDPFLDLLHHSLFLLLLLGVDLLLEIVFELGFLAGLHYHLLQGGCLILVAT